MSNTFGPESTNPRQNRAYAHALRAKAIASGESEDKIQALEAANSASSTKKGRELGKQTLLAFVNQYNGAEKLFKVRSVDATNNGFSASWLSQDFVRLYEAVETSMGKSGISVEKPTTEDEYYKAASLVDAPIGIEKSVNHAMKKDLSVVTRDYSIPGTVFAQGATHALAVDLFKYSK